LLVYAKEHVIHALQKMRLRIASSPLSHGVSSFESVSTDDKRRSDQSQLNVDDYSGDICSPEPDRDDYQNGL